MIQKGSGFRLIEMTDGPAARDINSGMGVAGADYNNNGAVDVFYQQYGAAKRTPFIEIWRLKPHPNMRM